MANSSFVTESLSPVDLQWLSSRIARTHSVIVASLLVAWVVGCSAAMPVQRADGTYVLDCTDKKACLKRADLTCGEEGYVVVGAKNNKKRYGAPGNEIYVGKSVMYIRCNRDRPKDDPELTKAGQWQLPKRNDSPLEAGQKEAGRNTPSSLPKPTCRPGETQRCIGPAACEGGQACLLDGSAFGPCDCGHTTPESTGGEAKPKEETTDDVAR